MKDTYNSLFEIYEEKTTNKQIIEKRKKTKFAPNILFVTSFKHKTMYINVVAKIIWLKYNIATLKSILSTFAKVALACP